MGGSGKWIKSFIGLKKNQSNDPEKGGVKNRKWKLWRSASGGIAMASSKGVKGGGNLGDSDGSESSFLSDSALAAVVRASHKDFVVVKQEWAALRIQAAFEELSIWGWPLQTAGLLTAGFSARSYAILSGRLTEWSNGEIGYLIRKASAVQMDPNTWILEYTLNPLTENRKLVSAVLEFLKFRLRREVQKLQLEFWLLSAFTSQHSDFAIERIQIPT
ncbi:hypothetical protein K7X08_010880 [Anisodus acutangulus]|uniref:Uncharacterized protein n=1 Tax=Anisodus acutangulus TaxID=402998 RepID=A0A9Q1RA73_9SOLA|nr:hypothetical protein K7X08_010880 [Anisodus acutangulus]